MESIQNVTVQEDLQATLEKCRDYGKIGNDFASKTIEAMRDSLNLASNTINEEINRVKKYDLTDDSYKKKLAESLQKLRFDFSDKLNELARNVTLLSPSTFSITLFGRTMAGKSTLMEILTHGEGKSIGKGSQRTTRDVRTYEYKGLRITDVPGIAAFEGQSDTETAFNAAAQSDMILFLITDDAPQACEAECLGKICRLGKPVVCLINVKADISSPEQLKMFNFDLKKKFEEERIERIKQQFVEFGSKYGLDWSRIQFAYAHLKSAFLSRQKGFENVSAELYNASRFNTVDDMIINEVHKNGPFFKFKAFADALSVPLIDEFNTLLQNSTEYMSQSTIFFQKAKKFKEWLVNFKRKCEKSIDTFVSALSNELKREAAQFVEDNYENASAAQEWNKILTNRRINEREKEELQRFQQEAKSAVSEIMREVTYEIKVNCQLYSDTDISMSKIKNTKGRWETLGILVSIGSFFCGGYVGAVCIGVETLAKVVATFKTDINEKKQKARQLLQEKVDNTIRDCVSQVKENMLQVLHRDILEKHTYPVVGTLNALGESSLLLSNEQHKIGNLRINSKLREINLELIKKALAYLRCYDSEASKSGIEQAEVFRIPNYAAVMFLKPGSITKTAEAELGELLKEKIYCHVRHYCANGSEERIKEVLQQIICGENEQNGADMDSITVECTNGIPVTAHIPFIDFANAENKLRISLAQQAAGLRITK